MRYTNLAANFVRRAIFNVLRTGWYGVAILILSPVFGFGSLDSIVVLFPLQMILLGDFGVSVHAVRSGQVPSLAQAIVFSAIGFALTVAMFWGQLKLVFADTPSLYPMIATLLAVSGSVAFTFCNVTDAMNRSRGLISSGLRNTDKLILAAGASLMVVFGYLLGGPVLVACFFLYQFLQFAVLMSRNRVTIRLWKGVPMISLMSTVWLNLVGVLLAFAGPRLDLSTIQANVADWPHLPTLDFAEKIFVLCAMPLGVLVHVAHTRGFKFTWTRVFWVAAAALAVLSAAGFTAILKTSLPTDDFWLSVLVFCLPFALFQVLTVAAIYEMIHFFRVPFSLSLLSISICLLAFCAKLGFDIAPGISVLVSLLLLSWVLVLVFMVRKSPLTTP